ncbi:MAG: Ig-like domain-containing protein [bacterium]
MRKIVYTIMKLKNKILPAKSPFIPLYKRGKRGGLIIVKSSLVCIILFQIFIAFLVYSNIYAGFKFGLNTAIKDSVQKLDEECLSVPAVVSITSPADGSTVSGTVSVTAEAAHSVGISKVEFYIDGVLKFTDSFSPYVWDWDTTEYDDRDYQIKVTAYNAGGGTRSKQISVTTDNSGPAVSITNPADGAISSGTVNVTAEVSDEHGISKVEFYIDGVLKFTDTSSPYAWNWVTTGCSESTHTVKITACDTLGHATNIQHTVTVDNYDPPAVSVTNPVDGSTVTATVDITADAAGVVEISKVEFYIDGILKSAGTSPPYDYTWNTTQYIDGPHTVKVIAHDAENQTASSQITVTVDNVPPDGEWREVDDDLVIVGKGGDSYLMWPRLLEGPGTNKNNLLQWKTANTSGEPVWVSTKTVYDYPSGENADNYPAFKWAQNLDYKGYTDWRLPTIGELEELYDKGITYINYGSNDCLSSDEYPPDRVYVVNKDGDAVFNRMKNIANFVRAVRESRTGGNSPPTISITTTTTLAIDTISSGTVAVNTVVNDDYGISRVEFYVDGVIKSTVTSYPYNWLWDTTESNDGMLTLKAIIYDISNQTDTDQITVKVDNTPPDVSITNPADGSTSSGTVSVTVSATDANGVIKVEFYIDELHVSTVTTPPYVYYWDTTRSTDGLHTVEVIAYDTLWHTESEVHTIMVDNWEVLPDALVKAYTGGGNYLMWPGSQTCLATNNNNILQWKTANTSGEPVWVSTKTAYDYPSGETSDDYPAFKWAENLVYEGYGDWRLPAKDELKDLYDYGRSYITYASDIYWSSSASSATLADGVRFFDVGPIVGDDKANLNNVRAVRDALPDEAPFVSITTPSESSTSSGTAVVTAAAYDDYGISRVEFYVDDVIKSTDTSSPYGWLWDTTECNDGTHTLKAIIYDTSEQTATNQIAVTADNTPPDVSIINPADGAISSGTVNISADATDNIGISKVEFYIDGDLKSTDSSSPYNWDWDTISYGESAHTVKVIAYNTAEQTKSTTHTVTVDNWQTIDDALVTVYTGEGNYLVWPSSRVCPGTNNGVTLKWAINDFPQPVWDDITKTYYYGVYNKSNYPAFEWAEDLDYKGYTDWRLPTIDELKELYDYGRSYIGYDTQFYWSSTMASDIDADGVSFETGAVDDRRKIWVFYVRAVRDSQ